MGDDLVYLDYAATAGRRPPAVAAAIADFLTTNGTTPGRGGHRLAIDAARAMLRCRQSLARLLDIPGDPGRIAFQHNATHALNSALHGLLREGDVVVTTPFEHNSVVRPLHALEKTRRILLRIIPGDRSGALDLVRAGRMLEGARLLVVTAASNVLGTATALNDLIALARQAGALVVVDAAQAAGSLPLSVETLGLDALALTGHKALLGPQGVGALWVREGVDPEPLLRGGTGGDSLDTDMPRALPDRLEAGTLNAPGIIGLGAALGWLLEQDMAAMRAREMALKATLHARLAAIDGVNVLSPPAPDGVAIVAITAEQLDPAQLAARLDREHGVLVRPGLHCAPGVHRLLGTEHTGAVRFSLGWASTEDDIDRAVQAVAAVLASTAASVGR